MGWPTYSPLSEDNVHFNKTYWDIAMRTILDDFDFGPWMRYRSDRGFFIWHVQIPEPEPTSMQIQVQPSVCFNRTHDQDGCPIEGGWTTLSWFLDDGTKDSFRIYCLPFEGVCGKS